MAVVSLYNQEGVFIESLELDARLFDVKSDPGLVHAAVVAQTANARSPIAHTKTRGEVIGSSKKPWKQKGTGRARHGSTKSPIWIGGGITFGPRPDRNFSVKINKKVRRKALCMALSDKVKQERLIAIDALLLQNGKTKDLIHVLSVLPVRGKKTLIILPPEQKDVARAARNLSRVATLPAHSLNVVDLLKTDYVLVSKEALELITHLYRPV